MRKANFVRVNDDHAFYVDYRAVASSHNNIEYFSSYVEEKCKNEGVLLSELVFTSYLSAFVEGEIRFDVNGRWSQDKIVPPKSFVIETWAAIDDDGYKWRKEQEMSFGGVQWSKVKIVPNDGSTFVIAVAKFTYDSFDLKPVKGNKIVELTNKNYKYDSHRPSDEKGQRIHDYHRIRSLQKVFANNPAMRRQEGYTWITVEEKQSLDLV